MYWRLVSFKQMWRYSLFSECYGINAMLYAPQSWQTTKYLESTASKSLKITNVMSDFWFSIFLTLAHHHVSLY